MAKLKIRPVFIKWKNSPEYLEDLTIIHLEKKLPPVFKKEANELFNQYLHERSNSIKKAQLKVKWEQYVKTHTK